jgi:hypothetical protein
VVKTVAPYPSTGNAVIVIWKAGNLDKYGTEKKIELEFLQERSATVWGCLPKGECKSARFL